MLKSRSTFFRFLAIASVLFCTIASSKAQDKVDLRLHLHPGQTFDQTFVIAQKVSQTIQNKRMDMTMTMRFGLHNAVLDVSDAGDMKFQTIYESIAVKGSGSIGGKIAYTFDYDSTKPSKNVPPAMQPLAALVGQNLITTASSRGEVLKIDGIDSIVQQMVANVKDAAERGSMSKTLKDSMNGQTKQVSGMAIYAGYPVAIGDSWKSQQTQTAEIPLLISAQYSLTALQNGLATLAVHSTLSSNAAAPPSGSPTYPIKMNLSGTQNGVMHVDEQSGLTRDFTIDQRISGKVSAKVPKVTSKGKKPVAVPMSWPIYIKSTISGSTTQLT